MNQSQKEIKRQYLENERKKFQESLPIAEKFFPKLFDFLEQKLSQKPCNHTPKNTQFFCKIHKISAENQVIAWLSENGGHCDCEILYNVSEHFSWHSKIEPEIEIPQNFKDILTKKQKINALSTDFGFRIEKVPSPWKLTQSIENQLNNYFFQIGKGMSVCLVKLQTDSVENQINNDDFWLSAKNTKNFTFTALEKLAWQDYQIIIATGSTTVVCVWCIPNFTHLWHLQMTTERQRYKGDLKELEKLTQAIEKLNL